jgi:hypothetical protein
MSEEVQGTKDNESVCNQEQEAANKSTDCEKKAQPKKNIIHFTGTEPFAIDLDKVEGVRRKGKTVYFHCRSGTHPVDLADEAAAESFFPAFLNMWVGTHVVE